jgi:hypothetical protein
VTRFQRQLHLAKLGFIVLGHDHSSIIPLLTFSPGKMLSRLIRNAKNPYRGGDTQQLSPITSKAHLHLSAKWDFGELLRTCDDFCEILDLNYCRYLTMEFVGAMIEGCGQVM